VLTFRGFFPAWSKNLGSKLGVNVSRQIGNTTYPVAKKQHDCMASEWIVNALSDIVGMCNYSEKRELVKARRNKWKILPGQKYLRQAMVWGGSLGTFKAIPEMHCICVKYDIYEDC
jgi:hypothetical protein